MSQFLQTARFNKGTYVAVSDVTLLHTQERTVECRRNLRALGNQTLPEPGFTVTLIL